MRPTSNNSREQPNSLPACHCFVFVAEAAAAADTAEDSHPGEDSHKQAAVEGTLAEDILAADTHPLHNPAEDSLEEEGYQLGVDSDCNNSL